MRKILLFGFALIIAHAANGQDFRFTPAVGIILHESKGESMMYQCSRAVPDSISSFWTPTDSVITVLEQNFKRIYAINSENPYGIGAKLETLEPFAFQYMGVIIHNKKYIYVNAFPYGMSVNIRGSFDIRTTPMVVCDGGDDFWGALFDPETKEFTQLSFNGVG